MKIYNKLLSVGLLLSLPALALTSCGKQSNTRSYMTVEINPGVEFVLDGDNKVITANGLNDDGETLISNVDFKGKTYEAALEVVVKEAEKTGYLVKETANSKEFKNEIKVSLSSTDDKLAIDLEAKINTKVTDIISKEKLEAAYKKLEAKTRAELEEIAKEYDPSLTDAKVKELTNEQLYNYVELATIEKAEIFGEALEEYYQAFKEYEFTLKYKEELDKALTDMTGIAVGVLKGVSGELQKQIDYLNKLQYDIFVNPESKYLKALDDLEKAKDKSIALQVKVSNAKDEELVNLKAELKASKEAIDALKVTLETIMDGFDKSLDAAKALLTTLKTKVDEAAKTLEGLDYNKMLTDVEKQVNDLKNNVINEFEKAHAKDIADAKAKVAARKAALEQAVSTK